MSAASSVAAPQLSTLRPAGTHCWAGISQSRDNPDAERLLVGDVFNGCFISLLPVASCLEYFNPAFALSPYL